MSVLFDVVLPVFGVILTIVLFASTYPAVRVIQQTKKIGAFNALPFPFLLVNCIGWVIYGANSHDIVVFGPNLLGVLTSMYYFLICFEFVDERTRMILRRCLLGLLVYIGAFAVINTFAISDNDQRQLLIGFATNAVLFCFYAAPLSTMRTVIRMRSAATISVPLCIAALFNCSLWIIYGIGKSDPFIFVPNSVGLLLNLAQFVLIIKYDGFGSLFRSCTKRTAAGITLNSLNDHHDHDEKHLQMSGSLPSSGRSSFEHDHHKHAHPEGHVAVPVESDMIHRETTTEVDAPRLK